MEPVPGISLRLDDIEHMNMLKNYKYTSAIWKWDRFPVFNLDYVTQERSKAFNGIYGAGGVFVCVVGIWISPFVPAV